MILPNFSNYIIKPTGAIYSRLSKRDLKLQHTKAGYQYTRLVSDENKREFKFVHRLVAEAYIDNHYDKTQVHHINNIKDDNRSDNLLWVTSKENLSLKYGVVNKYIEQERCPTASELHRTKCLTHNSQCFIFPIPNINIEFLYIKSNITRSIEHNYTHNVISIIEYYYNIPPVYLKLRSGGIYYVVEDGNHRVNTLRKYNLPIPALLQKKKGGSPI